MIESSMFQKLPLWHQEEVLVKHGTLLAQRTHKGWTVTLYALGNSFVERWTGKGAEVMASFAKTANVLEILEPYTDAINIQDYLEY
ncbi:hypothetical protein [Pontibacter rugosus]|uniref:Uncharacterized protein n=1 Tax=Pontibacter rugosus TaxID=1745966 RepID=A0ABW3SKG1_9BACT